MTNIDKHILSNSCWCAFILMTLIIFIYIVRKKNTKGVGNIIGCIILPVEFCVHAFLVYCYYKISIGTHAEIIKWHACMVVLDSVRDALIVLTVLVTLVYFLYKQLKRTAGPRRSTNI